MTRLHNAPASTPRWPILGALVAVVLGAHLVLLAGGVTLNLQGWPDNGVTAVPGAVSAVDEAPAGQASAAQAPGVSAMRVSSVRWIAPATAPAPQAQAAKTAPPPPKPAPTPRAKTVRPPPEAAVPSVAWVDPPLPPEQVVALVVESPLQPPESPPEAPPQAIANTPAPAETTVDPTAVEVSNPDESDDTLLAAATSGKPRSSPATIQLPPAQPPASTRLLYDVTGQVKGIGYRAEGTLTWTVSDGRYDARMEMRVPLLGSRSQTSVGRVGPNGLMPERFADKSRSEKAAHFEASKQRITFSNNAPEAPLQPGAQDRLSLFMQLAGLLQARPQAYATGKTVDMQVAGTGDAPLWRFDVGAESTLSLPAGEFKVRRLVRQPRKEFDSTVEMWLAPSLGYLPVRLRVTQSNGDVADQQLRQLP